MFKCEAMGAVALALVVSMTVSAAADEIAYVGSSTVNKFLTDAAEVYTDHTFAVDTGPESSGGEVCPLRGNCDMGGVARNVSAEALDRGVVATLVGRDAIAVIVHPSNPVDDLSAEQLHGIFTGQITNWSEVGGADAPISPYIVTAGSATRSVFQSVILDGADYAGAQVVEPDARMVPTVARDTNGIGQISFSFTFGTDAVRPIAVGGEAASVENPSYPITRPLYITTRGEPEGAVAEFLAWALSPDGQAVVRQNFVGVE